MRWTARRRPVRTVLAFGPRRLALMLLGMAGYRSGFLTGEWDDAPLSPDRRIGLGLGARRLRGARR